jgi:transcriptional regulatory protein LevR
LTGNLDWSLPVAIPDDVMTGGDGTAKKVGDLIHESFPKIQDIQIFVGFIRELKESTYKTHYVVTRDELIDIVWNTLSPMQQEAVTKERGL